MLAVARLGVALVAVGAAVISYEHVHMLALANGETALAAALYPVALDGAVAAGAVVVLSGHPFTRRAIHAGRLLLVLGLLASSAANVLAAATPVGRVGGALLPVLVAVGAELLAALVHTARPGGTGERIDQPEPPAREHPPALPEPPERTNGRVIRPADAEAIARIKVMDTEAGRPVGRDQITRALGIGSGRADRLARTARSMPD